MSNTRISSLPLSRRLFQPCAGHRARQEPAKSRLQPGLAAPQTRQDLARTPPALPGSTMVERLFRDLTENRMPADLVWAHSQAYEAIEYRCYTSDFVRTSCEI